MLATILYIVLLFCTFGGSAFNMGNFRMQITVIRYCNLDLVDADGQPLNCHISNSMETMGLVLPGMDDGKSFTTRQDIFITKDGQLTVEASPARPYEYIVMAHTDNHSHMIQFYNKTSFLLVSSSQGQEQYQKFNNELTLDDHGWVHHGLVHMDGEKLHKRVIARLNGTDEKTGMNYTALAMTGLIPNCWILYTNENDTRIVKVLATNTFHNDTVFQETIVTHWEELPENMTTNDTLQLLYSGYHIEKHEEFTSSPTADPLPDVTLIGSEITGEVTREFFRDAKNPDWMPSNQLRGSNGTVHRIDYFKILPGTASYKFFHALSAYRENGRTKFELPTECTTNFITSKSPYCLYVNFNVNEALLALDLYMSFVDINERQNHALLNVSVRYSSEGSVLDFSFDADGCAIVWQAGVSFANLNIAVCVSGSGAGKSLLQPDNATYRGAAAISVSFNIYVKHLPTVSASIEAGYRVSGAPHNNITTSAYLKLSRSLVVVGTDMWVEVVGNTVNRKINTWMFETLFNLRVWVNIVVWKHSWTWTWSIFKVGPVTF